MRIKLVSDLHIEFWQSQGLPDYLTDPTDILILAGDIAVGPRNVEAVLNKLARFHGNIIYVPGNHEYYGQDINTLDNMMLAHNVHFLNPSTVKLNDITFIGATMWTDFRGNKASEKIAGKYITDFKRIKGFSTQTAKELYARDTQYISEQLAVAEGKIIVVTHFLPGTHCVHPRWAKGDYPTKQLNDYFSPDPRLQREMLANLTGQNLTYWLFGHTHDSIDVMHNNVRYIANPYGYQGHETNPLFNENLII